MSDVNDLVWNEKYRPKTIDDCILPELTKQQFRDVINTSQVGNLLMYGPAGTGKTSACRALANELGADLLYLNASLERSIDIVRNQVTSFSSAASFSGAPKIVLLDEFDGLPTMVQNSLKGVIEEFKSARFFFTSNHVSKVVDAIRSRCSNINFRISAEDKPKMATKIFKRICYILEQENVKYDRQVVAQLINKYFPDFRRTLNELQAYAVSGEIDVGILASTNSSHYAALVQIMKEGNFRKLRGWVAENRHLDPHVVFREFYDESYNLFKPDVIPMIVLLLADYEYKASQSVDPEIVTTAGLTEVMNTALNKWL
jgi:DNA polymerase III delta prime subunit